jgi:hypothetical protein
MCSRARYAAPCRPPFGASLSHPRRIVEHDRQREASMSAAPIVEGESAVELMEIFTLMKGKPRSDGMYHDELRLRRNRQRRSSGR